MLVRAATLLLVLSSAAIAASTPVTSERTPLDLQLRQARAEAAAATAEQQRLEKKAAQARDEVGRLHAQQLAATQAIAATEAAITAADAQARIAEARLQIERQKLASAQAPISSLLGALVLTSRRPPLLMLAQGGSTEDLVKLRVLVDSTAPVVRARTAALARQVRAGAQLEQAALAARHQLRLEREELGRRRARFAELERRAVELAKSRGSVALGAGDVALARQEQLADLQARAASTRESARLAQELAALGPVPLRSAARPSGAPLRYRLPANAAVVEGLGAVDANGVRSRGVLLATRRGAPLAAPADGTIVFSGPFRDYDGVVIIDHGGGWKSVLVNAGSRLQRGAAVRQGEPIGIALGPVEIQLQHEGKAVSPALIAGSSAVLSNPSKGG
jgi:septal ring factor EnvC (AmiA/AmiB activator)